MWLLPLLSHISRAAARAYYGLTVMGEPVPQCGPVLLVANHPNALFDPALVSAAARRPVRFLAKAPLFREPGIGWLVRGSGAIPVYRPSDDPTTVRRNEESFRAVHAALAEGAAVGIFPEGISHSEPGLAPLKTGAARIALGAAALLGRALPIIPVGLSYRQKERFRSEVLVVIGQPPFWDDLAGRGGSETHAVRELTSRIALALREVTVNLERWEDAPLIEATEAVYAAEKGGSWQPLDRVLARREAAEVLTRLRRESAAAWEPLAADVLQHVVVLRELGLRPEDLGTDLRATAAARWTLRQLAFFLLAAPLALLGSVLFFVPYRLTGYAAARLRPTPDVIATYHTLGGALFFLLWILLLAGAVGAAGGATAGVAALLLLPPLGALTLVARDSWYAVRYQLSRFLMLASRTELRRRLREQQRELAERLHALRELMRA